MSPRRADVAVGLIGAVLAAAAVAINGDSLLALTAAVVLGAVLSISRQRPLLTWTLACAAIIAGALTTQSQSSFFLILVVGAHAFLAGRHRPLRIGIFGLLLLTSTALAAAAITQDAGLPAAMLPVAAWAAGRTLGERERLAERLAEQARELEAEHDAHARLSVRYERARIAAELHDIVAHAITLMVVQASAGQRLVAVDAKRTAQAFVVIAGAARQAEADLGRLVAMLGDDVLDTAPDLSLIDELVGRAASSGLKVSLRLEGDRESLSPAITQLAYRVVQEGLTNALRHAPGASIDVRLRGEPAALLVEIANARAMQRTPLADSGTGNGLRGLRERVAACGGSLEAETQPDGGWRLAARLPRRATSITT